MRHITMSMHASNGYTLVEILVVITIIMIMGASVIGSFNQIDRRALDTDARKLIADVYMAKKMAINTHRGYYILFDQANRTYRIYSNTDVLIKVVKLRSGISVANNNLSVYSPRGNTSGTELVTLQLAGRQKNIRIYPSSGYLELN